MGHYESFVVRLWVEGEQRATRGQITDVQTKVTSNFRNWDKMIEFMVSKAGDLGGERKPVIQSGGHGRPDRSSRLDR